MQSHQKRKVKQPEGEARSRHAPPQSAKRGSDSISYFSLIDRLGQSVVSWVMGSMQKPSGLPHVYVYIIKQQNEPIA